MNPAQRPDYEGRVIAGRYLLESKLGEGGMGSVWAARHLTLDSKVAVKLLDPSIAQDAAAAARFAREAQAAASLRSPHVVQILDHGIDGSTPFIAMELLEGENLAERLARVGRLSPEDTARIVTEVARAVARAHESGIIHRDIKPENVFLSPNDDIEIAKVLDFGIAKQSRYDTANARITQSGTVFGSPYYMSPEQAEGAKDLDHRTDIWSLAVVAYECLLGARPFEGQTLASLFLAIITKPVPVPSERGPVPAGFDAWFGRATQRDPRLRFETVREAAAALREICKAEADLDDELSRRFERVSPIGWWPLVAGGVLVLGAAAYALSQHASGTATVARDRPAVETQPRTRGPALDAPAAVPSGASPADSPSVAISSSGAGGSVAPSERTRETPTAKSPGRDPKPRRASKLARESAPHRMPRPRASAGASAPAPPGAARRATKIDLGL